MFDTGDLNYKVTGVLFLKILSGGASGGGTADTAYRRMGYLKNIAESIQGQTETTINAHPAPSSIITNITGGNFQMQFDLMEATEANYELRAIAQGINPNDYAGTASAGVPIMGNFDPLVVEIKVPYFGANSDRTDEAAITNCIGYHLYNCVIDTTGYSLAYDPIPDQNDVVVVPLVVKGQSDPDNENLQGKWAHSITADITVTAETATGCFADIT